MDDKGRQRERQPHRVIIGSEFRELSRKVEKVAEIHPEIDPARRREKLKRPEHEIRERNDDQKEHFKPWPGPEGTIRAPKFWRCGCGIAVEKDFWAFVAQHSY